MPAPGVVVVALAALAVVGLLVRHVVRLRRALVAERAARRLTAGIHARDLDAFARRLDAALRADRVVEEAETILDSALAAHRSDPEGGAS